MIDDLDVDLCEVCSVLPADRRCVVCGAQTCENCGSFSDDVDGCWLCDDCLEAELEEAG